MGLTPPRVATFLTTVTSVAVVLMGCGAGDDAPGATSLSKAEFIERASAVCVGERAGLAGRMAAFERRRSGGKPEPYGDAVHFVFLPTIEAQLWRLQVLRAPPGDAWPVREMLGAQRVAIDSVAVRPRVASIAAAQQHFVRAGNLFRAYGLSACAADGN